MTEKVLRKMNRGWTTRDIMVTTILSIVAGLIYIPLTYFTGYLIAFPFLHALVLPFSYYPIFIIAYIIRKPGVALFSAAIAYLVQVPLTPRGVTMLMSIFFVGLPVELILLVQRYKNFKLWYLLLMGAICGLFSFAGYFIVMGVGNLTLLLQIVSGVGATLSGALGGLLAKWIGDAVIKTGVVSVW